MSKMIKTFRPFVYCTGISSALLLSACSSSPTPNYYTLTTMIKQPVQTNVVRVIEVLPVDLPDRLDRTQLVLQTTNGQSRVLDQQRWTSTLSSELKDGLSAGLLQRLGAVDRYASGSATSLPVYRIAANFSNFDALQGTSKNTIDNIHVAATWTVSRIEDSVNLAPNAPPNKPHSIACRMMFSLPANTDSTSEVDAVVTASRQSLDKVTNAIAESVVTLEGGAKPVEAVCS
ncbi:MAG: membrane integrity-associated transporter subunit PqiC [Gammaproteobacteria bacterium]|nr:membrane integrity-associated transporter subunit PqiC [Gammaproteobacteria bacterium]